MSKSVQIFLPESSLVIRSMRVKYAGSATPGLAGVTPAQSTPRRAPLKPYLASHAASLAVKPPAVSGGAYGARFHTRLSPCTITTRPYWSTRKRPCRCNRGVVPAAEAEETGTTVSATRAASSRASFFMSGRTSSRSPGYRCVGHALSAAGQHASREPVADDSADHPRAADDHG